MKLLSPKRKVCGAFTGAPFIWIGICANITGIIVTSAAENISLLGLAIISGGCSSILLQFVIWFWPTKTPNDDEILDTDET